MVIRAVAANAYAAQVKPETGGFASGAAQVDLTEQWEAKAFTCHKVGAYADYTVNSISPQTLKQLSTLIATASAKSTPVDADTLLLIDSADSGLIKELSWSDLKSNLKDYFDTLYSPI